MTKMSFAEYAAAENAAARKQWNRGGREPRAVRNSVETSLKPLIGSGITQVEAASRIGCSVARIGQILKKKGWAL